ncbi:MAG: nuclear transport factor 2 family protein [Burkholderiaceae bacterium]
MPEPDHMHWEGRWGDLEAIRQLKARYCRFVDTKQWTRLAALFVPGTVFEGFGSAPTGADERQFIAGISARLAEVVSIHHCHTPEIAFTGERSARGIWQMMDYLQFPDGQRPREAPDSPGFVGWGYYEEDYRLCDDGRWRFCFMRLTRQRIDPLAADHPPVRAGFIAPTPDWL